MKVPENQNNCIIYVSNFLDWSPDISSFYCSDINLFLIDYVWCKLCNKWWLLFENNSMSLTLEGNLVAVITQDRVIDDNLKRQIKNRTLHNCTLFLISWIFQDASNCSKVLTFTHPLSSIYIARVINFQFFHGKQFFSWLSRFIYKLGSSLLIILGKLPILDLPIKSHPSFK